MSRVEETSDTEETDCLKPTKQSVGIVNKQVSTSQKTYQTSQTLLSYH